VRLPALSDKLDSAWLAVVTECGSPAGSFVPPEGIHQLRAHTRYRRPLTAEKQRADVCSTDSVPA
jgi:hypothetical protein